MKDELCPKCKIGTIILYTKPNGNYLGCSNCDWSQEAFMAPDIK